ncbi:MAG: hypothetical protein H0W44_03130 [Gammaproteobacteria bacterium]|nr:hypothetical protein [Gammaproteobacteria bacterium]
MFARFEQLIEQHSQRALALVFVPLHFSIWQPSNSNWANILFIVHLGLFLLWQPFINRHTRVHTRPAIIVLLAVVGVVYLGAGWAQTLWCVLLSGIFASYRGAHWTDKSLLAAVMGFLLWGLFAGLLPTLIPSARIEEPLLRSALQWGHLSLLLLPILLPARLSTLRNYSADLLYSTLAIAVVVLLTLLTLLGVLVAQWPYLNSLIYALLSLAGVILVFNFIFKPDTEHGLLAQLKQRYLLNIGTPLDQWLSETSLIAEQETTPAGFLDAISARLLNMPWLGGLYWEINRQNELQKTLSYGNTSNSVLNFTFAHLRARLYLNETASPAVQAHAHMLMGLVNTLYESKWREQALAERAHMQAIYETGARLTHDVKNLIHSLGLIITVTQQKTTDIGLLRSLEVLHQRLQQTLVKLRNPEETSAQRVSLEEWWQAFCGAYKQEDLIFSEDLQQDRDVVAEVFDTVAENLVNNALAKRRETPALQIHVNLRCDAAGIQLSVKDNGNAVPVAIAEQLLKKPIDSKRGYGIGLYQAAKQAQAHGYHLVLEKNLADNVTFCLRE